MDKYIPINMGFYSIGLGLTPISELIDKIKIEGIPFLHLRGGAKGYNLLSLSKADLSLFIDICKRGPKVTMLTSDFSLSDFFDVNISFHAINSELNSYLEIAHLLSASSLRVLATEIIDAPPINVKIPLMSSRIKFTIELHNPYWFTPQSAEIINNICNENNVYILLDSGQVHEACKVHGYLKVKESILIFIDKVNIIHISDNGFGVDDTGHHLVFTLINAFFKFKSEVEIAFEWTGMDRSSKSAFLAYHKAMNSLTNYF